MDGAGTKGAKAMLGERIGENKGKVTARRVIAGADGNHRFEVTAEAQGRIYGVDCTETVTYLAEKRADGTLYGEGQGILMTREGESAQLCGTGVGRFTGRGQAVRWVGSLYYKSEDKKLARLCAQPVLFEHEVDENGNFETKYFEWK